MPPFFPTEDPLLETKEWASSTIDSLFSDSKPISFEPVEPYQKDHVNKTLNHNTTPTRRSLSLLESNVFNNRIKEDRNEMRAWTTSFVSSSSSLAYTDSPPALLTAHPQKTISYRLKHSLSMEKPSLSKKMLLLKEHEGIEIWKTSFSLYLREPKMPLFGQSPHLLHFILNELITTEKTYFNHLSIIKYMFMDPLLEATSSYPKALVNIKDIQTIFAFIPEIISLSSILVSRLKDAICTSETGEIQTALGKVFCDLEDRFEVYIRYAANFSNQQKAMARVHRTIVYKQLVQDSVRKKETNKMELSDYMIAPIQRITRYGLLLKDILKHSDPSSPGFSFIHRSLQCHLALAHAMNEIQ